MSTLPKRARLSKSGKQPWRQVCRASIAAATAITVPAVTFASLFYWTGDHDTNWNTTGGLAGTNWSSSPDFNNGTSTVPGAADSVFFVLFGAGNLNTSLGRDFSINSLTFTTDAVAANPVAIGGTNTLTLGSGGLTNNSNAPITLSTNVSLGAAQKWANNSTAQPLLVTGAISSPGANTLTLSGVGAFNFQAANTYTGSTVLSTPNTTLILSGANGSLASTGVTLAGGTILTLDNSVSVNNSRIGSTVGIASGGGTFNLLGSGASQTVGTLTLNTGQTQVSVANGSTLTFGSPSLNSLSRGVGGAVNFGTTGTIALPMVTLDSGGIIGSWATIGNISSVSSSNVLDFATVSGGNAAAFSAYTLNSLTGGSTTVVKLNAPQTLAGNVAVDALYVTSTGAGGAANTGNINIGTNTLTIGSGGIIANAITQSEGFSGVRFNGTIGADNIADIGNGVVNATLNFDGSAGNNGGAEAGSITSSTGDLVITGGGSLRINSAIIGAIGLTKNGTGLLDLSNGNIQSNKPANTYTGITTVNGGTLVVNQDNQLGAAPGSNVANQLTLNGGILLTTAGFTFAATRGITVGPQGGTFGYTGGNTWVISQQIVGTGAVSFESISNTSGGNAIAINNANNTYQGSTTIISASNVNATTAYGYIRITQATNAAGTQGPIPVGSAVTVTTGGNGPLARDVFDLSGNNLTIGSLAGNGNVINTGATPTLTMGGNNLSTTFTGTIGSTGQTFNTSAVTVTENANLNIIKLGTGIQVLAGIQSYTGTTAVNGGTLLIGSGTTTTSSASLGNTAVTVGNGTLIGALGGNGTINGPVTVTSTGHLAPAMSPSTTNTLTINNSLTIDGGATLDFNFAGPATNDTVTVTAAGTLTVGDVPGATITLNVSALPGLAKGAYKLFDASANSAGFINNATFTINGTTNFNYKVVSSGATFDNAVGGGTVPLGDVYLEVLPGNPAYTWVGNTNGNWNTTTPNWTSVSAGPVYSDGSNVTFDDTATGTTTIAVASAVSPSSMLFNNATFNYTFSNSSITVAGTAGITKNQGASVTFNDNVTTTQTLITGGTITVGAGQTFASTTKVSVTGGQLTVNGALNTPSLVEGAGGALSVGAAGSLNSSIALTLNGTTTFNNPSQTVASLAGSGAITLNSTALNLGTDTTFAGPITGSGTVNVSAGTVTLSGANGFHGGVVSGGSLILSTPGTTTGTFETQAGTSITAVAGALGTSTVKLSGGSLTLNDGAGSIVGLAGAYYNNTPANVNNSDPDYASLASLTAHLSTLTPALVAPTTTGGSLGLDFSNANFGAAAPFASQGFATITNIEALFSGKFDVTNPGPYTFTTRSDDGSVLFIDGNMVVSNNFYQGATSRSGTVSLGAGLHDISIGYYQGTGGSGLLVQVTDPTGLNQTIPNTAIFNGAASANYGNNVQLVADGLIDVPNALSATMGTLTMASSTTLTTTNGSVVFTGTTLTGAGPFGFSPTTFDIVTGPITSTGAVSITKSGAGALVLDNTTSAQFTAAGSNIDVTGGSLAVVGQAGGLNPLGNASVTFETGTLGLLLSSKGGNVAFDADVTFNSDGAIYAQKYGSGVAAAGTVTFGATHSITTGASTTLKVGAFDGYTLTLAGTLNGGGDVNVAGGTVNMTGTANVAGNLIISQGGTLNVSGSLNNGTNLVANGTINLTSASQTVGTLNGSTTGVVALNGNGTTGTAFNVTGTGTYNGILTGIGSVTKSGNGSLTLSNGGSTYQGGTTVTGGALLVTNTTGSATGTGPVLVQSTGALGGTGLIGGPVTLNGTLTPGSGGPGSGSIGTLNLGNNLTVTAGGNYELDLANLGNSDAAVVTGTLTLNGAEPFNINALSGFGVGNYVLATATGGITNNGATLTPNVTGPAAVAGLNYQILVQGNQVILAVTSQILTWTGATDNNWDFSTMDWKNGSGPQVYADTFAVTFDDTGSNPNINIASPVAPLSMVFNNTVNYTIGGAAIGGFGNLIKNGTGTVTLTGVNSFAGSTTINNGILSISADENLGAAPLTPAPSQLVINGGTLAATASFALSTNRGMALGSGTNTISVAAGSVVTYAGIAANMAGQSGSLTKTGNGELDLSGASTFSGGLKVNGGAVKLLTNGAAAGTGPIAVNTGTKLAVGVGIGNAINLNDGGTLGVTGGQTLPGNLTISGNTTLDTFDPITGATNNDVILTGMLQGSGNVTVANQQGTNADGTGWRLRGPVSTGVNTYSGTITLLNASKFEIQTSVTSGSQMGTGKLVMTGGTFNGTNQGTFSLMNVRNLANANTNIGNNIQLVGSAGTYAQINLISGPTGTTAAFGNLSLGDQGLAVGSTTGGTSQVLSFTNVTLTGSNASFVPTPSSLGESNYQTLHTLSLGVIDDATSTNPNGSGITMAGNGTLVLNQKNTYRGATTINSGTTLLGAAGALPSTTALTVSSTGTDTAPTTLNFNNAGTSSDQTVASLAGTLNGVATATVAITNSDAANTRTLTVAQSGVNTAFAGAITGNLNLVKSGNGTLQLTGANTFTGSTSVTGGTLSVGSDAVHGSLTSAVTVSGGTLAGNGQTGPVTVQAGGVLAPGNVGDNLAGIINVTGALNLSDPLSHFYLNLGGTTNTGTAEYDQAHVTTGSISLGGDIQLTLNTAGGYVPTPGDTFYVIVNSGGQPINGTFSDAPLSGPASSSFATYSDAAGDVFEISYTASAAVGGQAGFTPGQGTDVAVQFFSVVPEPGSLAAVISGMGMLLGLQRFRRRM